MKPKISVIMAAHNSEMFIMEAIESILAQSFKDFELLIAVGGSTDNTLGMVRYWESEDKRVKLIECKKNGGPSEARNKALEAAKGKYIAILDSDDVAFPNRLKIQYKYLEENPDVFLCGGGSMIIDFGGKRKGKRRAVKKVEKSLPHFNPFCHSTVMFRNDGYRYREKLLKCEDYDFFLRLLTDGKKMVNLDDILIFYRAKEL